MTTTEYTAKYVTDKKYSPRTSTTIRNVVLRFTRFIGRDFEISELTEDMLEGWLQSIAAAGATTQYVERQRQFILGIWQAAHHEGLVAESPFKPVLEADQTPEVNQQCTLESIIDEYCSSNASVRAPKTRDLILQAARRFKEYLGREPLLVDLCEKHITGYIK